MSVLFAVAFALGWPDSQRKRVPRYLLLALGHQCCHHSLCWEKHLVPPKNLINSVYPHSIPFLWLFSDVFSFFPLGVLPFPALEVRAWGCRTHWGGIPSLAQPKDRFPWCLKRPQLLQELQLRSFPTFKILLKSSFYCSSPVLCYYSLEFLGLDTNSILGRYESWGKGLARTGFLYIFKNIYLRDIHHFWVLLSPLSNSWCLLGPSKAEKVPSSPVRVRVTPKSSAPPSIPVFSYFPPWNILGTRIFFLMSVKERPNHTNHCIF